MKFACIQENLNHSLHVVNQVKGSGATLPILENILIKVEKGVITLASTDLEIGITSVVRGKAQKDGEFTVPSHLFSSYIGFLPNKQVEVELVDNSLEITCDKNQTKINGQESSEFPVIPSVEDGIKYSVSGGLFKSALKSVLSAINPAEVRTEISGVLFCFNCPDKAKLTLVGTDSYRLAERKLAIENFGKADEQKIIIPFKTVQSLASIIENDDEVEIFVNDNQILFVYQENEVSSRLIQGDYPDYKQIIPKDSETEIVCSANELIKAVKSAGLFSRSGINDINLKFISKDSQIVVSSVNDQVGENVSRVEAEITGKENEITFNHRYLLDGLQSINSSEVYLSVVDSTTPGVIRPVESSDQLYVVMPIGE